MKRLDPLYSLRDVSDLASAGRIQFSRKAQTEYLKLGFTSTTATECIAIITRDEYRETLPYDVHTAERTEVLWFDDYVCPRRVPKYGASRDLYIKIRISGITTESDVGGAMLLCTSFHEQRAI